LVLSVAAGLEPACYEDALFHPRFAQGLTRVFLTDAPFPYETVGTVEVYVIEISASTDADTTAGSGTWSYLAAPMQRFDLLQLQQSNLALVGELPLPTDMYHALRVTIDCDSSIVTFNDGTEANVRWPSDGAISVFAQVAVPIAIPDSGTSVVIDFDVGQSFAFALGDPIHDFIFTPKIRAVDGASTGSIAGTILGDTDGDGSVEPITNAVVSVSQGDTALNPETWDMTATGKTDSTGYYRVGFLHPATYTVQLETPAQASFGTLIAHDVEVVAGEDFVFSVTLPVRSTAGISSWR
jgi:hypothetical protein